MKSAAFAALAAMQLIVLPHPTIAHNYSPRKADPLRSGYSRCDRTRGHYHGSAGVRRPDLFLPAARYQGYRGCYRLEG